MNTLTLPANPRAMTVTGYVLSALAVLFLILDSVIKLVPIAVVIETLTALGYPPSESLARGLGILTLICVALYVAPRTAPLGAVLLTGYLGGAMATHLRIGSPVFTHLLFGLYLGLMIWGGLWLRDPKIRSLIPLRSGV